LSFLLVHLQYTVGPTYYQQKLVQIPKIDLGPTIIFAKHFTASDPTRQKIVKSPSQNTA